MPHTNELSSMALVTGLPRSHRPWYRRRGWLVIGGGSLLAFLLLGLLIGFYFLSYQRFDAQSLVIGDRPQRRDPLEKVRHAAALYRVSATPLLILGDESPYEEDFDVYRRTLVAYVTSPLVILSAISSRELAECGLLNEQENKIAWLQENLIAYYPRDGEILAIALPHPTAEKTDLLAIVNAVAKAYYDEVIFTERSRQALPLQVLKSSSRSLESRISALQERIAPPETASVSTSLKSDELLHRPRRRQLRALLRVEQELLERISREEIMGQGPPRIGAIGSRGNDTAIAEFHDPEEESLWFSTKLFR